MEVKKLLKGPNWVDLKEIDDNELIWFTYKLFSSI